MNVSIIKYAKVKNNSVRLEQTCCDRNDEERKQERFINGFKFLFYLRMMSRWNFIILVLLLLSIHCQGQNALARDEGIEAANVPEEAVKFVNALQIQKKVRWIKHDHGSMDTYEAHTMRNGKKISASFDSLGQLIDVQQAITFEDISSDPRAQIQDTLKAKWHKYWVVETEEKYFAKTPNEMKENLNLNDLILDPNAQYELHVYAKLNGEFHQYVCTFDNKGILLDQEELEIQDTNLLEN